MLAEFGPERIRNTPISEIAIVGAGIGAAIQGMLPVVEIMYEDFLTISMEQIVNQAAKHRTMSGGQVKVPLTIRTQGGAGWSPGAQHAQQLEAWFTHVPGLKVVFASTPEDVRGLLWSAIYDPNPVHLLRAPHAVPDQGRGTGGDRADPARPGAGAPRGHRRDRRRHRAARPRGAPGRRAGRERGHLGRGGRPAHALARSTPSRSSPRCERRRRCVTAHEAVVQGGFGAELAAVVQHGAFDYLDAPIERVGAKFAPLPFAPVMEEYLIPHASDVLDAIKRTRRARLDDGDRGQAPAPGAGHGVRHDRALAQVRGRGRQEARAAVRARHRQGHAGGRGRGRRRAAQDPRHRGRGRCRLRRSP